MRQLWLVGAGALVLLSCLPDEGFAQRPRMRVGGITSGFRDAAIGSGFRMPAMSGGFRGPGTSAADFARHP
jgi:hypothetical protein